MRIPWCAVLLAVSVIGCGDNADPQPASVKPDAPTTNDPAFQIRGLRHWYIVGNPATPGNDTLKIVIDAPAGTGVVDAWIAGLPPQRLQPQDGEFALQVSIAGVPAGTEDIVFAADGQDTAFASVSFKRSAPYYVMVSTDWDFSDPGDQSLMDMEYLHVHHPIRMTDFVGPYTFTDPAVTPERRRQLAQWLVAQRDQYHDEIGLHIHPYCNFVTDAGLTCNTTMSTVYPEDTSGYTIELDAYSRAEMGTLLDHAADLFATYGLGRPKVFRAGGWTLGVQNMLALVDKGYASDSSPMNWARLYNAWHGHVLYTWNMEHWGPIDDTSQPYYPTQDSTLGDDAAPTLPMLEVPVNGVMIDYASLADMKTMFGENWDGTPLDHPVMLMMGFHPATTYSPEEQANVDGFLSYSDKYIAIADLGPVVYTTLSDLIPAFPPE
jgi:hypothetical protein